MCFNFVCFFNYVYVLHIISSISYSFYMLTFYIEKNYGKKRKLQFLVYCEGFSTAGISLNNNGSIITCELQNRAKVGIHDHINFIGVIHFSKFVWKTTNFSWISYEYELVSSMNADEYDFGLGRKAMNMNLTYHEHPWIEIWKHQKNSYEY